MPTEAGLKAAPPTSPNMIRSVPPIPMARALARNWVRSRSDGVTGAGAWAVGGAGAPSRASKPLASSYAVLLDREGQ